MDVFLCRTALLVSNDCYSVFSLSHNTNKSKHQLKYPGIFQIWGSRFNTKLLFLTCVFITWLWNIMYWWNDFNNCSIRRPFQILVHILQYRLPIIHVVHCLVATSPTTQWYTNKMTKSLQTIFSNAYFSIDRCELHWTLFLMFQWSEDNIRLCDSLVPNTLWNHNLNHLSYIGKDFNYMCHVWYKLCKYFMFPIKAEHVKGYSWTD